MGYLKNVVMTVIIAFYRKLNFQKKKQIAKMSDITITKKPI